MAIDKFAVGNRIRQFIAGKQMKIKDFAEQIGMSAATLQSSYLNGRSLPGAEILLRLEEMGCDTMWLLTGKTTDEAKLRARITELESQIKMLNEHFDRTTKKLSSVLGDHTRLTIRPIEPVDLTPSKEVTASKHKIHHRKEEHT